MRKDQFITDLKLEVINGVNKVVVVLNDGSTIRSDLNVLSDVINKISYRLKELWIDVPGNGMEDLGPRDLVKFHTSVEYDNAEIKSTDKYIQVDDLLNFIYSYGKK